MIVTNNQNASFRVPAPSLLVPTVQAITGAGRGSIGDMPITFKQAYARFPACCIGAWNEKERIEELIFACDHEMTMYAENQDGCITSKERRECSEFLSWLRGQDIDTAAVLRGEAA